MASTPPEMIRLLLVGNSILIRQPLRVALDAQKGLRVTGEANHPLEAVHLIQSQRPNMILLAVHPENDYVLNFIPRLLTAEPAMKLITVFSAGTAVLFRRAVRMGALGVVYRKDGLSDLVKAIRCVHNGESWIDRWLMAEVITEIGHKDPEAAVVASGISSLTDRECEIFHLIGNGFNNKVIMDQLGISKRTVESHLCAIYRKLHITNRTELTLFASGIAGRTEVDGWMDGVGWVGG